tara:strand:+ start:3282 stop:4247 length:966 start_codon:yes stop_codon:yes gene_type:complete
MSKIVITGIAGFIGFHTALKFKSQNLDVIGFDNFNEIIYDKDLKLDRAKHLEEHGISVNKIDLKDAEDVNKYIKKHNPVLVIHLAAHAGVRVSMNKGHEYIQNNIIGTQNLIDAMEKNNIHNVIYASTSCTMEGNELPWAPDEKLGPQLNPYGYSKQTNENQFQTSSITNAICLRFFTVYGPWGRPDMALFDFTKSILEDKPIKVFNNGDMKRDFTYVDDIVQGIEIISKNMTKRDTYCLGYGTQVELMEFIDHIETNLGKKAEKIMAPKHPADALETWSDTSKLQKLGYNPSTPVSEGVKKFVEWYKNYYVHNNEMRKAS